MPIGASSPVGIIKLLPGMAEATLAGDRAVDTSACVGVIYVAREGG